MDAADLQVRVEEARRVRGARRGLAIEMEPHVRRWIRANRWLLLIAIVAALAEAAWLSYFNFVVYR